MSSTEKFAKLSPIPTQCSRECGRKRSWWTQQMYFQCCQGGSRFLWVPRVWLMSGWQGQGGNQLFWLSTDRSVVQWWSRWGQLKLFEPGEGCHGYVSSCEYRHWVCDGQQECIGSCRWKCVGREMGDLAEHEASSVSSHRGWCFMTVDALCLVTENKLSYLTCQDKGTRWQKLIKDKPEFSGLQLLIANPAARNVK